MLRSSPPEVFSKKANPQENKGAEARSQQTALQLY